MTDASAENVRVTPMVFELESPTTPDLRTHRLRRFLECVSKMSCIWVLSVLSLGFKSLQIFINLSVLYLSRSDVTNGPFRLFLVVYTVFVVVHAVSFLIKNRGYLIYGTPLEFTESAETTLFNNLLDIFTLFWYFVGFKWLQEYKSVQYESPLLYYTSKMWIFYGIIVLIAPLVSIVVLLLLINYIKPKMPVIEYVPGEKIKEEDANCTICLCPYNSMEKIRKLPCQHHFHMQCIDEWFGVDDVCPLCKKPINPLYEIIENV